MVPRRNARHHVVVTDAGLLVVGIETVVVQTMDAKRKRAAEAPEPKQPTLRAGTTQAMLTALFQAPEGATMEAIIAATGWQAHSARARCPVSWARSWGWS